MAPKSASAPPVTILLDEGGLVAADKPAEMVTIPDHAGASSSLLAAVARALGATPETLHPTSRLDRGVSGVVVFARTPEAAARLSAARERGAYSRRYVAIAASAPASTAEPWNAPIGRARDPRHRMAFGRDPAEALTRYAVAARAPSCDWALLALEPVTGRTHQLRVHASHAGAPLLGDRTYGGPTRVTSPSGRVMALDRIALHAARVRIPGVPGHADIEIAAPVPASLVDLWTLGGGDASDWARALLDLTALRG